MLVRRSQFAASTPGTNTNKPFVAHVLRGLYVAKHREIRIAEIARQLLLESNNFDLIGLQELWMQSDYKYLQERLRPKYPHSAYFHSGAVGSGLATFSKFPIDSVQFRRYSLGGRPEHIFKGDWFAAKGAAVTRVLHPSGARITMINTHMAASYNQTVGGYDCYETHRLIQAYEFGRLMYEQSRVSDHVIGLGDFNIQPESIAYSAFLLDEAGIISGVPARWVSSAFAEVHKNEPQSFNAPENTYRKNYQAAQSIDHIFHSGLSVLDAKLLMTERVPHYNVSLSDHFAITATFSLERAEETTFDSSEDREAKKSDVAVKIANKIAKQVKKLRSERSSSYALSTLMVLITIFFFTWTAMLTFHEGGVRFGLKNGMLLLASFLCFVFAFGELFKGFAYAGEELAAHLQFVQELKFRL